jgi:hypothetical protein
MESMVVIAYPRRRFGSILCINKPVDGSGPNPVVVKKCPESDGLRAFSGHYRPKSLSPPNVSPMPSIGLLIPQKPWHAGGGIEKAPLYVMVADG